MRYELDESFFRELRQMLDAEPRGQDFNHLVGLPNSFIRRVESAVQGAFEAGRRFERVQVKGGAAEGQW